MFHQLPNNMDIFSYKALFRVAIKGNNVAIKSWNPGYLGILEKFIKMTEVTKCLDSHHDGTPLVWSCVEADVMEMIRTDPDMEEYLRNTQEESSEFKSLNDVSVITRLKEPAQGIRLRCWLYDNQPEETMADNGNKSKSELHINNLDMLEEKYEAPLDACDLLEGRVTEAGRFMDERIDTMLEDMNRVNENIENEIEKWLNEINAAIGIGSTGYPISTAIKDGNDDKIVSSEDRTDRVARLPQSADIQPSSNQQISWKTIC